MTTSIQASSAAEETSWTSCAMLMWGVFSTKTPEGSRYVRRCFVAGLLVVVPTVLFAIHQSLHLHYVSKRIYTGYLAAVMPLVFGIMAWEFRKYLLSLDELARRLQVEAMAWTYLTGFVLAATFCGIWLEMYPQVSAMWLSPLWFLLLEPVRAGWLYALTRRY